MKKNLKVNKKEKGLVIYQAKNGAIEFRGDFQHETIWATLDQIAVVFGRDKSVVSRHIKNIFNEKELVREAVVAKNATTASDGKVYQVEYYNLDVIISVGYRVNSKVATEFRKWATKTLREYLVKGYVLNKKQIQKNHQEFLKAVDSIQSLLPEHITLDPKAILELVKEFSSTWKSLDAYDKESLTKIGSNKKSVKVSAGELIDSISVLRKDLIKKEEATDIFAQERVSGSVEGI